MNLIKYHPLASALVALVVTLLAVFGYLYATDPDREPASATGSAPASAPSVVAPSAGTPSPTAVPDAGEASSSSSTGPDAAEPEATPSPSSTAAQPNSALSQHAPEEGDWREPAEGFSAAYYDTHGGDKDAWLAGMEPYVTEDLLENFTYTHIANVVDDEVESVESVEIEPTTMTFKINTADNGNQTIALMELQPSGAWVVSAVGLTSTDLE